MTPAPRTEFEQALLRRRCLIETVFDDLKNLCQLEPPRHRAGGHCLVNLLAGIVADCVSDNNPTLKLMRVRAVAAP